MIKPINLLTCIFDRVSLVTNTSKSGLACIIETQGIRIADHILVHAFKTFRRISHFTFGSHIGPIYCNTLLQTLLNLGAWWEMFNRGH